MTFLLFHTLTASRQPPPVLPPARDSPRHKSGFTPARERQHWIRVYASASPRGRYLVAHRAGPPPSIV